MQQTGSFAMVTLPSSQLLRLGASGHWTLWQRIEWSATVALGASLSVSSRSGKQPGPRSHMVRLVPPPFLQPHRSRVATVPTHPDHAVVREGELPRDSRIRRDLQFEVPSSAPFPDGPFFRWLGSRSLQSPRSSPTSGTNRACDPCRLHRDRLERSCERLLSPAKDAATRTSPRAFSAAAAVKASRDLAENRTRHGAMEGVPPG